MKLETLIVALAVSAFVMPPASDAASKSRPARTSAASLSLDAVNDSTLTRWIPGLRSSLPPH